MDYSCSGLKKQIKRDRYLGSFIEGNIGLDSEGVGLTGLSFYDVVTMMMMGNNAGFKRSRGGDDDPPPVRGEEVVGVTAAVGWEP